MLRPLRSLLASQGLDWVLVPLLVPQRVPLALLEQVLLQVLQLVSPQGGQHLCR
jgi:hypothetical protein